jgi:hypothetical protein
MELRNLRGLVEVVRRTSLHHLVCDGQLDVATAQRQIASDWIVAL